MGYRSCHVLHALLCRGFRITPRGQALRSGATGEQEEETGYKSHGLLIGAGSPIFRPIWVGRMGPLRGIE